MRRTRSPKWHMVEVSWFNDGSREGVIRTKESHDFYVHYSAIESSKKRKTLKENQKN